MGEYKESKHGDLPTRQEDRLKDPRFQGEYIPSPLALKFLHAFYWNAGTITDALEIAEAANITYEDFNRLSSDPRFKDWLIDERERMKSRTIEEEEEEYRREVLRGNIWTYKIEKSGSQKKITKNQASIADRTRVMELGMEKRGELKRNNNININPTNDKFQKLMEESLNGGQLKMPKSDDKKKILERDEGRIQKLNNLLDGDKGDE